jgi:hypothetical protein
VEMYTLTNAKYKEDLLDRSCAIEVRRHQTDR